MVDLDGDDDAANKKARTSQCYEGCVTRYGPGALPNMSSLKLVA